MPWLPDVPTVESATFKVLEGTGAGAPPFAVQFNPVSLEYTIATEFDDRNGNNGARQFVKKSTAKLTMTLVFDTTHLGISVRDGNDKIGGTNRVAALLQPAPDGTKKFAPKVEFGWGTYSFKGVVEQFKETIDFFSASGVPLRSSINLTLASQEVEFQSSRNPLPAADRSPRRDPVAAPAGMAPKAAADALGDPRAARDIASANGSDSLRFGGSASLSVGGEISLSAAASFSVGASAGVSAGAGIGIGGGIGASAGSGLSLTATAGAAFAGLRISAPSIGVQVDDARAALLPQPRATGAVSFSAGGRAQASAGGSLSADVGANLNTRIGFGD